MSDEKPAESTPSAPKAREDFVHLHTHSDMSQLDGAGKISEYVKAAAARGAPAISFTEHGSMRGYYTQNDECKEQNIKPVFGIEFYVANDMRRRGVTDEEKAEITKGKKRAEFKASIKAYEEAHGLRDRWHLTVWAKNNEGLKNLYKLSSMSWLEGFYYKPRIDLKTLMEHGDGLIVATGCLTSPINDRIQAGKRKKALEVADLLRERFEEDLWIEIQPHDIPEQVEANKFALELKDRWGGHARLLATQDAHYVEKGDHEHHEILLCIGTGDKMSNPDRFKFDGTEFYMKTRREMFDTFMKNHGGLGKSAIKEALDNTLVLTSQVETKIEIDRFKALLPPIDVPEEFGGNESKYIKDLCFKGWVWRDMEERIRKQARIKEVPVLELREKYKARLQMELKALASQKFVPYFLIVRDLYDWVRSQGIMCGPGRGSAAGSIVAYLLGITAVDPIEHALLFERFISPTRIDMPDIDMDFEDVRRQEIIEHLRERYGADKVCQIATVGKLSGKQCLKDVSRVLNVPLMEVNQVTHSIVERSSGDERASQTIEDSFKEFKVCREFNEKYPLVLHHAKKLEGMAKNLGIHAAGVVCSPVPLTELCPLETRLTDGKSTVVSAIDMYGIQGLGLLKMDVLGLRTLTVLRQCLEAVEKRHGVKIDLEADLELNDPKILKGFTDHDYVGIFQYDSPGADKICSGVKFVHFEDVAAMTALNRPGTARSGLATQYVERKKKPALVAKSSFHPKVSEITADTLGIIVYQEHVLRIFTDIAGFAPATADSLRKKIAKKFGDETIGKERENFIKGAIEMWGPEGKARPEGVEVMTEKTAAKIMDAITFFGSYGFNKSHATAYGMIAYWGMWLKIKYPLEFYWALLKNEPDRLRVQQIAKDAKKHDIELLPPSVSVSGKDFIIDSERRAIRGSLVDIKGVGEAASAAIMKDQPYSSFIDFLKRVERRKVHKGVIAALAKAGALDDLLPNTKWFVENVEKIWAALGRVGHDDPDFAAMIKASAKRPGYTDDERMLMAASVNPLAFGKHPVDAYGDFIEKNVKVPIASMSDEDFFSTYNNKGCWVIGVIVEVKYNQVGDFHTGPAPSDAEKARMGWGKRYANVNVEDVGGKQNRIKVDTEIFDDYREIVDSGVGTAVILHASVNKRFENMRAHFLIDLEQYRKKIEKGEPLNLWEKIVKGEHPAKEWEWGTPEKARERQYNDRFYNDDLRETKTDLFTGIVTHVKTKPDKRDAEMAFFGLIDVGSKYIDCVCFASHWITLKKHIATGRLAKVALDKGDRGGGYLVSGRYTEWLKKSAKDEGAKK